MQDVNNIDVECRVFSRYLSGRLPDEYISRKYAEAFSPGRQLTRGVESGFENLLLRIAVLHPVCTRAADVYSRFFCSDSVARKRLVMLLAILETWAPASDRLDDINHIGKISFLSGLIIHGLISGVLLLLTVPVLLPVQVMSGSRDGKI